MARPSSYDPAYCDAVIAWGEQGKSVTWMAAELDVSKQTLHNWAAEFPEFLDALTRAKAKAQKWWEDAGQAGLAMPGFNGSVYAKSMAARFPEDWRDNKAVELTGANGGPVQNEMVIRFEDGGDKPTD
jgi:hypothetical protein